MTINATFPLCTHNVDPFNCDPVVPVLSNIVSMINPPRTSKDHNRLSSRRNKQHKTHRGSKQDVATPQEHSDKYIASQSGEKNLKQKECGAVYFVRHDKLFSCRTLTTLTGACEAYGIIICSFGL
ncbi:hypothetical protein CHARACLAT_002530 [Characodon lateralis]|uniref:Uncharacterized protein n=1 Tax=Characodon lateralis TaxID=208331 RepID=A0ABU7EG07_9TELE|nr:hypothetical protein [Characodon lateralis]